MKSGKTYDFFFILGRPRSGTTLLMTMLDAHPEILIPIEIPIISDLFLKYGKRKKWDQETLKVFYSDLLKERFYDKYSIQDLPFNFEQIRSQILASPLDTEFQDLVKIVYSNYISWFPKNEIRLLGDKNPSSSKDVKNYLRAFPEAKFIHIRRDYRDHTLSMLKAGFGIQSLAFICQRWKKNLQIIERNSRSHPNRFMQITYENLAQYPENTMKLVCSFLNIDFHPAMLEFYKQTNSSKLYPEQLMKEYQSSLLKPITTENIGTWKNRMTQKQIRLADAMVGPYAEKYGYERIFKGFCLRAIFFKIIIQTRRIMLQITGMFISLLPHKYRLKLRNKNSIFA